MSQQVLDEFQRRVNVANKDFTKKRSCLKDLFDAMQMQITGGVFTLAPLNAAIAKARKDKRGAKYEAALKYVEANWGKPPLQYKGPNQGTFTDLTGRLYVLKGSSITVQRTGTTDQKTVTFPTASAADGATGEQTFTARFGTTDYTFKAVVYELVPKVTFKDPFGGRSQTDVGLDERLTLGFDTVPAGIPAAAVGGLRWGVKGATGAGVPRRLLYGQVQKGEADTGDPAADGTAYYIAPFVTDRTNPKNPRRSSLSVRVDLTLTVQTGPMEGEGAEKALTVHTPQCRMVKVVGSEKHVSGKPSAGFVGEIYFDPKTVSFKTLKFMEGRGTLVARQTAHVQKSTGMGLLAGPVQGALPPHPSGYFAFEADKIHQHTGGGGVTITGGHSGNGCKINGADTVYSGWNDRYPNAYDGITYPSVKKGLPTNVPSTQRWPIYWKVYPLDLGVGEAIIIQQVVHESSMDASGAVTISKAGATVTKNLSDPTENP